MVVDDIDEVFQLLSTTIQIPKRKRTGVTAPTGMGPTLMCWGSCRQIKALVASRALARVMFSGSMLLSRDVATENGESLSR